MVPMPCPVLVGRDDELRALTDAVDAAAAGHGSLTILVGDPGVGKSRLASEAARYAADRGFGILTGHAVESATPVPLRPLAEAVVAVARSGEIPDAPELAEYWPALGLLAPEWNRGGDSAELSPLILGEAVLRLLGLVSDGGTVLVLEELQWADPETLAVLEYLADNVADRRVACVATVRQSEPSPALELIGALHARRVAEVIEVRRLAEPDLATMAAACLDQDPVPGAVLTRLLANCDGLPFAVEEILTAAVSSGELARTETGWQVNKEITTGLPPSIVSSVRRRLDMLGPDHAEVLISAAVLGREFDWRLLPGLTGATEQQVLAALRRGRDVQLIEPQPASQQRFRFRHSLTRQAIVSDLLPPDLSARAGAAAAAVEHAHPDLPGGWCDLAAKLHQLAGQPLRAARLQLRAGRRALRQGALTSAITSLSRARQALDDAQAAPRPLAVDIDNALARALELIGDAERLRPVAARLIDGLEAIDADLRWMANVRIRMARALSESYAEDAAEHLAVARKLADLLRDPAMDSRLDAVAALCAIDAGDLDQSIDLARRALALADAAPQEAWAPEAAYEALEVIGRRERVRNIAAARAAFERAYQIATAEGLPIQRISALHELGTIEMMEDIGTRSLTEARELAVEAGALSTVATIDLQLAFVWSVSSDPDRGLAVARRCEESAARLGMRRLQAMAVCVTATVHAIAGDRRKAETEAARAEQVAPDDPEVLFTTWGQVRTEAALFQDDLDGARQASMTGIGHGRRQPQVAPRRSWGYWVLLETLSGGDGRAALAEARSAGADVSRWNRGCLSYAEAVLEGRDGRPDRATTLADQAADYLAVCGPWWNHLLRRLVAPAAIADGWGQPVVWLRDAIGELEESGHARVASACRGLLRKIGERVPRQGRGESTVPGALRRLGVTSREMDVLLLVGRGLSNAEIGARLYISPKTVETHIASLVAKTGQSGRRALVAHAAGLTRS